MTTTSSTSSSSSTSSTSGSSILTALGAGTGIDTDSLVTNLTSATFDPRDKALKAKEDANTAKISALGTLTSGIDSFAKALQTLVAGGTLKSQPTSSDSSIVTAATQAGTNLTGLSAQIEVRQIATAQSIYSPALTTSTTAAGLGSLTLTTAAGSYTVTIDSTNNTLAGLANAINATNTGATPSGVTASVVTDANGARLVVKGATGAANSFSITPNSDADADLSRFATTGTGAQMTTAQAAQDAIIRMDGLDTNHSTNTVSDLIPGVTLSLIQAKVGTKVSLGLNRPTDAITQAVNDFVSAYNTLKGEIDSAVAVGSGGADNGPLYGSPAVRALQRQLRAVTSTALTSLPNGPQTLAEIGVSTAQDGTLSVDSTKLSKALSAYPDSVEAMFNPTQRSDNPLIKITSAMGSTKPGTYTFAKVVNAGVTSYLIAGKPALPSASDPLGLVASVTSDASGLAIQRLGDASSATITVDAGLSGVLQGIRDSMRATGGVLDTKSQWSLTNALNKEKTTLADSRTKLTDQENTYKDQLTKQFSAMQTKVASYKSIQSYMTQQIAIWSKSS